MYTPESYGTSPAETVQRSAHSNLQDCFQQLLSWSEHNDMAVNFQKTKEMVMGPPSLVSNFLPIQSSIGSIEQVTSVKLLGLHLDANFSWRSHVEAMLSKATKRLYFLKLLKRAGVPCAQLQHFYVAVIRPILEYAAPVWHHLLTNERSDRSHTKTSYQYYSQSYSWHAIL